MSQAAASRAPAPSPFGRLLREWRARRGASQLRLALEAGVSPRHLSFVETGRSQPSREMVLRLAEALDVPLRERNALLHAAGFAAVYNERPLGTPDLAPVERMLGFLLERLEPFPALLVDRCGRMLRANAAAARVVGALASPAAVWRESPPNLLRLTLHPEGLRPYLVNFDEVASALLLRYGREASGSPPGDPLATLVDELRALPGLPDAARVPDLTRAAPPVLPLHLKRDDLELRLFSALTTFGTPQDVTLQDLHLESLMPADADTEARLRAMAGES